MTQRWRDVGVLALAFYRNQRHDEALTVLERPLPGHPDPKRHVPVQLALRAMCQAGGGNAAAAEAALVELEDWYAQNPYTRESVKPLCDEARALIRGPQQ